jgi:hypothetical protein
MRKISIGVDIGSNGGYAIIVNGILSYGIIPYISKGELDMSALKEIIHNVYKNSFVDIHVVIEDLHSVFGSSAKSNFAFGINNGLVIGMLQTLELPYIKVAPKTWQKEMWQGIRPIKINTGKKKKDGTPKYKIDTKATSLIAANRLFPKESFLATERSKKSHDGIVDAVLLAEYCRRKF